MFNNLRETVKALNADAKNVANCEKAKNLRKKLHSIGLPLAILGFLGVITCFVLFVVGGMNATPDGRIPTMIVISAVLLIPCGIIASIGISLALIGLKIAITGYATNMIDETVGHNCPKCGEPVDSEKEYCSKCGTKLKKECPNCKHSNDGKAEYCESCGTKLDK